MGSLLNAVLLLGLLLGALICLLGFLFSLYRYLVRSKLFPQLPRLWKGAKTRSFIFLALFLVMAGGFGAMAWTGGLFGAAAKKPLAAKPATPQAKPAVPKPQPPATRPTAPAVPAVAASQPSKPAPAAASSGQGAAKPAPAAPAAPPAIQPDKGDMRLSNLGTDQKPAAPAPTAPAVPKTPPAPKAAEKPAAVAPPPPLARPAKPAETATPPAKPEAKPQAKPAPKPAPPPAKATPAPAKPAPPPANGNSTKVWTVCVSSHRQPGPAKDEAAKLKKAGLPAEVVTVALGKKGTWHRVCVGRFKTQAQAAKSNRLWRNKGLIKDSFLAKVK